MTYFVMLSRKLLKAKVLLICIVVYVLVSLYTNQTGTNLFHGKPKETELRTSVLDLHDQYRMEMIKHGVLKKENHKLNGAAQSAIPRTTKINESQTAKKEKENDMVNSRQRRSTVLANNGLPSLRAAKARTGQPPHASCKEKGILKRYKIDGKENIACTPHSLSTEACRFTKEAYKIDKKLETCRDNRTHVYCYLKYENSLEFACRNLEMYRYCKVSGLDWTKGDVEVIGNFIHTSNLALRLQSLAKMEIARKSNFLFLKCFLNIDSRISNTQLILLPFEVKEKTMSKMKDKVSMNIILLDSISRAHFYRSLPRVLQAFNDINSNANSKAEVLDFELFQAVHGHSAENFHAFFTGELLPRNLTESQREHSNVGVENLYGVLKNIGYETMYQDDLCWKYWWGMRMELGMAANWRELRRKIRTSNIDHTGRPKCCILSSAK